MDCMDGVCLSNLLPLFRAIVFVAVSTLRVTGCNVCECFMPSARGGMLTLPLSPILSSTGQLWDLEMKESLLVEEAHLLHL